MLRAALPKQGVSPGVFGEVTWVSSHKLSHQGLLTCAATVAITRLLPCSSCRTSISLFSKNVMNPAKTSDQRNWWIAAHGFVSAKLGKPIPTEKELKQFGEEWKVHSAFKEVFAMLAFFIQHFGMNEDVQALQTELLKFTGPDPQVHALASAGNFSELVSIFNRESTLTLPEHLVVWAIEGARSISR